MDKWVFQVYGTTHIICRRFVILYAEISLAISPGVRLFRQSALVTHSYTKHSWSILTPYDNICILYILIHAPTLSHLFSYVGLDPATSPLVQMRVGVIWREECLTYAKLIKQLMDLSEDHSSPQMKDAVLNSPLEEVSLILAIGAEKTLEVYEYATSKQKEQSLAFQFVNHLKLTGSPMPLLCNLYTSFFDGWSRSSNQAAPLLTLSLAATFAATGPRTTDMPAMKPIAEMIKDSSEENSLQGLHNLGVCSTRRKCDEYRKKEDALNAIPQDISLYMKDKLNLRDKLTCPTDQIRALVLEINSDGRKEREGWNPDVLIFIIIILVWVIDNLNLPHKSEIDNRVVMENLISIMVIVKEYAMSYNEMIEIVGVNGDLKNTLVIDREKMLESLEQFKDADKLQGKFNEDLDDAQEFIQGKMLEMFTFVLQNDLEVSAEIALLREKFKDVFNIPTEDIEKAYQKAICSKLEQNRTAVRTEAYEKKQRNYRKDKSFYIDLFTADSNATEPVQRALGSIQDRAISLYSYNPATDFPKDSTIVVDDHQIWKIGTNIIINEYDYHDGGKHMFMIPGYWHLFAQNGASVAEILSPTMNNTLLNMVTDKPGATSGMGCWQGQDNNLNVGLRLTISELVLLYQYDLMTREFSNETFQLIRKDDLVYLFEIFLVPQLEKLKKEDKNEEYLALLALHDGLDYSFFGAGSILPNIDQNDPTNLQSDGAMARFQRLHLLQKCIHTISRQQLMIKSVKDRDSRFIQIYEKMNSTLAPFLDAKLLRDFINRMDVPYLDMYLDGSLMYNVGMDGLRSEGDFDNHHVWTLLTPKYTITNKVNYLPLALFCRALYYVMSKAQQRLYRKLGSTGTKVGRLDGIDESLEETMNLDVKQKHEGIPTAELIPQLGNLAVKNERRNETIMFLSNVRNAFLCVSLPKKGSQTLSQYKEDSCIQSRIITVYTQVEKPTIESNSQDMTLTVLPRLKFSSRVGRANRFLAKWRLPNNEVRIAFSRCFDTRNDPVHERVITNSNVTVKSPMVSSEERNSKVKMREILQHVFERLERSKLEADNQVLSEYERFQIWTPTGSHVIGLQDKLLSDVDEQNRVTANCNNGKKGSQQVGRLVNRGKKLREIMRTLTGDDANYSVFIGAYCVYIKKTSKYVLSNLPILSPVTMILNDLRIPVALDRTHGGVLSFPISLARNKVEKDFNRMGNSFTHMLFHQSHFMNADILFQGGGTCIHVYAEHLLCYLLDVVRNNDKLEEIFISCHDFSRIEDSANRAFVDESIKLSNLIPFPDILKEDGNSYIGPKAKKGCLEREEYYQRIMSYMLENIDAVFVSYINGIKDVNRRKDLLGLLYNRFIKSDTQDMDARSKVVKIFVENIARFTWSNDQTDRVYISHEQNNDLIEIIWTVRQTDTDSRRGNSNSSSSSNSRISRHPIGLSPTIIRKSFVALDPHEISTGSDAAHLVVSKLTTLVNQHLQSTEKMNAKHFCVVGEDSHILLGILLSFAQNEFMSVVTQESWLKALTRIENPVRITYRHSNFLVKIDNRLVYAVEKYKNIDNHACQNLGDRLITIVGLIASFSNAFVPSNASFESTEKKKSSFIEGLDQVEKYMVQFRNRSNYRELYIVGLDGLVRVVPIHMYLAFFMLKANKGDIYGSILDKYRLHLVHDTNDSLLMEPQQVIDKIVRDSGKFELHDCNTPPGKTGFLIKSQIIQDSVHYLAIQCHDRVERSQEKLPRIVEDRNRPLNVDNFNTTEIWFDGEMWKAIILTHNVFIIRQRGLWRILVIYCLCTGHACNKLCLCHRFCRMCGALCFRTVSPLRKERKYQHVLRSVEIDAEEQYKWVSDEINVEMDNRIPVTFRHVKDSASEEVCDYYGQVGEDYIIKGKGVTGENETVIDTEETVFIEPEGLRLPEHVNAEIEQDGEGTLG